MKKKNKYSSGDTAEIGYHDFVSSYEAKRKLVENFNLMDDIFFTEVMKDASVCTYVLRKVTGIKTLNVLKVNAQYFLRNLHTHSVVLDILAEDESGKLYNIELQKSDNDHHPKRIRYYQASVDISFLEKGCSYSELPECWFIFISGFDPFGLGDNCYEIERKIKDRNDIVENGVHEIYLNTKVSTERDITKLLKYFENSDADSTDFGPLSERVRYLKKDERGKETMCEKVQRLIDESNNDIIAKMTAEKDRIVARMEYMAAENSRMSAEIERLKAQLAEQQK